MEWSPEDRAVFEYNNGSTTLFGDPAVLRDQLYIQSAGGYGRAINDLMAMNAANGNAEIILNGMKARAYLADLAQRVFGMNPFNPANGSGATVDQCLAVLGAFIRWLEKKNTNTASTQTTSPPTDSTVQTSTLQSTSTI